MIGGGVPVVLSCFNPSRLSSERGFFGSISRLVEIDVSEYYPTQSCTFAAGIQGNRNKKEKEKSVAEDSDISVQTLGIN